MFLSELHIYVSIPVKIMSEVLATQGLSMFGKIAMVVQTFQTYVGAVNKTIPKLSHTNRTSVTDLRTTPQARIQNDLKMIVL